jgi:hypothetical protein
VIATQQTLETLDRMLREAGFDSELPDPLVALRVFRAFAEIPVECADDRFLFQVGIYSVSAPEQFSLDLTRQFAHEEDGEYIGMEQLHCTIYYEPTAELRTLENNLWSSECASVAEFFERVAEMPEFQIPLRSRTPLRADIAQEEV